MHACSARADLQPFAYSGGARGCIIIRDRARALDRDHEREVVAKLSVYTISVGLAHAAADSYTTRCINHMPTSTDRQYSFFLNACIQQLQNKIMKLIRIILFIDHGLVSVFLQVIH